MEVPDKEIEDKTEEVNYQLAQVRAALETLSQPTNTDGVETSADLTQKKTVVERARAALDSVEKILAVDNLLDHQPAKANKDGEPVYSTIFDNSPFALALTSMPGGNLVRVNTAFLRLFDYTLDEVIGKTSTELDITDPASRAQVAELFQKDGAVRDFECTRKTRSGDKLYLSLSLDWLVISGEKFVLTTIRDITEECRAKQANRESLALAESDRQRLMAVMQALPVGVAILDERGGNIQANQAFDQVWGELRPQVDGVGDYIAYKAWWADSGLPVEPDEWASAQAVMQGKTVIGQALKIQKFDGSYAFVHNSAAPIFDQRGQVAGCVVVIQDFTDLKSHEAEVQQLNRTLKALSDSNQAMMHAVDENNYLNEVCRIIIEDCNYAMVWIGYAENDEQKSVIPMASAGFDRGYLSQMRISWADTERGRGPTGIAIRTQKPTRCDNMLTDPKFAPWREAALSRGYASSIVLPLVSNGQSIGALNIYSREPDGFPEKEEKLLLELAGDLSYGITSLRLKADQAVAQAALRQSEERYRTIVETSSEGICMYTPEGNYTYVNKRMADMLGYQADEMLGKSILDFACAGSKRQVLRDRKALAKGESVHGEFKFCRKDGTYVWSLFNASPIVDEHGKHVANLVLYTDITERKQLEDHLAYLASFPEMNPRPIIEIDLKGTIKYTNLAAIRLFPEINERGTAHPYLTDWREVVKELKLDPSGVLIRDVQVNNHYYEQSFNLLTDQNLMRIYGMDITERRLVNQVLIEAHEELEQRVLRRTEELNIANEQLKAEVNERQKTQTELESSIQELQVIEEELRNNNEMLLDAQKVLDTERQRYQDLFDYAPDSYLVTDSRGQIMEANHYASDLLNIPHHRLVEKPLMIFVDPADHLIFSHLLNTLPQQVYAQSHELRFISRQGNAITASVTVAPAKDRTGKSVLRWTLRDISERKRAEEIIRRDSLRNQVLSELSESLVEASLDEKSVLELVTRTCARLIGDSCVINLASEAGQRLDPVAWYHTQPDILEIMDTIFAKAHHPSDEGLSGKAFQSAQPILIPEFEPGSLTSISKEIRRYIEQVGIASVLVCPLQVGNQTLGTISLIRNTAGRPYTSDDQALLELIAYRAAQTIHNARLYDELQEALRKELETHDQLVQAEKFAAVGRLLASITHEINNPLQTIKNCLYLCQIDTPPNTSVYDALTMATTETNRLSNLVAQLREIYRPPTKGIDRPVDIPRLLNEVQLLLAGYLQEKHVTWQLTPIPPGMLVGLHLEGVADQLKQVFLNLALNSIDAMEPQGGKITIDLKSTEDESQLGISFKDTGPGLSQEIKDKLFEPFTTTKEKGLGLGLAICYDIIQKHRGSIEVQSASGEGAEFTIWLPASKGAL